MRWRPWIFGTPWSPRPGGVNSRGRGRSCWDPDQERSSTAPRDASARSSFLHTGPARGWQLLVAQGAGRIDAEAFEGRDQRGDECRAEEQADGGAEGGRIGRRHFEEKRGEESAGGESANGASYDPQDGGKERKSGVEGKRGGIVVREGSTLGQKQL